MSAAVRQFVNVLPRAWKPVSTPQGTTYVLRKATQPAVLQPRNDRAPMERLLPR